MVNKLYIHAMNIAVKIMNLLTELQSNMAETHEHNTKQKKQVSQELFSLHTVQHPI